MINFSENVVMLEMGEELPPEANEFSKILLAGSIDLSNAGTESGGIGKYDWITKFGQGLATLVDPIKGIPMLKGKNFLLISTKYAPANPEPSYENQEFVNKVSWTLDMAAASDYIFINFLKKSTSIWPLFLFGVLCGSNKCVVRCSSQYQSSGLVKIVCERNNIPYLPSGTTSVYSVISTMQAYIGNPSNGSNNQISQADISLPE